MLKNSKKLLTLVTLTAAVCSSNILNAWGYYGAVLHDPKTGHIVRLLGDRHAYVKENGNEDKIEKEFISNIRDVLNENLKISSKKEILIIECVMEDIGESMNLRPVYFNLNMLSTILAINIYKLLSLHPGINKVVAKILLKQIILQIGSFFRDIALIDELVLDSLIDYNSKRMRMYDLRSALSSDAKKMGFKNSDFIKSCKFAREIPSQYQYDAAFSNLMKLFKDNLLNDETIDKFALDSDVVTFSSNLSDYGFLSSIGRARKAHRNITLYTGGAHSQVIAIILKELGYEVLFLKENDYETPLSKEDCEKFFSVQPDKKVDTNIEEESEEEKEQNLKKQKIQEECFENSAYGPDFIGIF